VSLEVLIGKIIVLLALSVAMIYFGLKLKMPAIVGFLATGIAVGPQGLALIRQEYQVEALSELGVVLLLFTIGLEFSLQSLKNVKRVVLLGGPLQIIFSLAVIWPAAALLGFSWNTSLLFGFLFALSSTAIVLKLFQDVGEMDSLHGRGALGVLIFQDLAVVPMMLALPLMAGQSGSEPLYSILLKTVGILAAILVLSRYLVPKLLERVAATKSRELFLFAVALICLGTAYLTAEAGLSLALGAFVAGLIISGSPFAYQAISSVMPMRDIFTSLFFVSIGMRMDLGYLFLHPFQTVWLALGVMAANTVVTALAMRVAGLNGRVSVLIGFSLCQVGEFAFVLAQDALGLKLLSTNDMTMFLNAAVLTMAMTPLALVLARRAAPRFKGSDRLEKEAGAPVGHAVVVGFGVAGQGAARACKVAGRPYVILDLNPQSVQMYRQQGEPITYGDAVSEAVMEHASIDRAGLMVVSIPDPLATRQIVALARKLNPNLHIVARTRFLLSRDPLQNLGADEVVVEEYEAALNVFQSTMSFFQVPPDLSARHMEAAKSAGALLFYQPEAASPPAPEEKETSEVDLT
jgi:CPA2 family monovalent cation:H+ antiporter-2